MNKVNWEILDEVAGNATAELIRSFLEAHEISVLLSQEGAGHFSFPVNVGLFGRVQILVPANQLDQAQLLIDEYNAGTDEIDTDLNSPDKRESK